MVETRVVPLRPENLTLETRVREAIRLPGGPPFTALLAELEAVLDRQGIEAERREEGSDIVLSYRCTIEEAIRLGFDRRTPDELLNSVLREYPWLDADVRGVRARLAQLKQDAGRAGAVRRRPPGVRRGTRRRSPRPGTSR